jgi:hypothetical protein
MEEEDRAKRIAEEFLQEYYRKQEMNSKLKEEKQKFILEVEDLISRMKLDLNWMRAAVSIICQDIMVYRLAKKMGIDLERTPGHYKSTKCLLDEIEPKLKKKGLEVIDLRIARLYSEEFRNGVIHRGLSVDEKRSLDILNKTKELLDLLSKVFSYDSEGGEWELAYKETWNE